MLDNNSSGNKGARVSLLGLKSRFLSFTNKIAFGPHFFSSIKKKELGKVIVSECFLLRNFDSVSKELTHLKELEEGNHLCLSEAKNT